MSTFKTQRAETGARVLSRVLASESIDDKKIIGCHQDNQFRRVADFECGHTQHVGAINIGPINIGLDH